MTPRSAAPSPPVAFRGAEVLTVSFAPEGTRIAVQPSDPVRLHFTPGLAPPFPTSSVTSAQSTM